MNRRRSRAYELRARAVSMAATRRRITEATVDLHGSIGPARTTVAAIAEAAGVQRHTVYRHFPTEDELFSACAQHYWDLHPWPDPREWESVDDPIGRLRTALTQMYRFYAEIEPMLSNVLRDAGEMEVVARAEQVYRDYVREASRSLAGAVAPGRPLTRAAVRHAMEFSTWRSLVRQAGISSRAAVGLMLALVAASTQT